MKINSLNKTALIIIDVQKGFDEPAWGKRNNPEAEQNIFKLLNFWRKHKLPLFHIKNDSIEPNSPLRPEKKGNEIKDIVKPQGREPLIIKNVNCSFIGTDLEERLRKKGIKRVVIVGLTTDHCVSTTARIADNLGFEVIVVSDATATFDRKGFNGKHYTGRQMHEMALVSLEYEFAKVLDTQAVLKQSVLS